MEGITFGLRLVLVHVKFSVSVGITVTYIVTINVMSALALLYGKCSEGITVT